MGNDTGFSHTGHDGAAFTGQDHLHCRIEMLINAGNQVQNGFCFHLQNFLGIRFHFVHDVLNPFSQLLIIKYFACAYV